MEINADFTARAAVHAAQLPWVASPLPGVDRRMLDRVGEEVARATSIVRYAPGSHFSAHIHEGGEEFLVLDGVFQDEHGDYPAGTYVRNPPTTRHTPGAAQGCTIFVKLWQFEPSDRTSIRVNSKNTPFLPAAGRLGVEMQMLFEDSHELVRLERWAPDRLITLEAPAGVELLVIEGEFFEAGEKFTSQSWLRLPAGASLQATPGPQGCQVWIKLGHLLNIQTIKPDTK